MSKSYRPWSPDHPYLLPPDPRSWLPDDHLAHFVLEVAGQLDISKIEDPIQNMDPRGERPYAPRMMLGVLILQGYNCQVGVDGEAQIIVAQGVSNQAPDTDYLVPMLERVRANTGALPEVISADAGYWAPGNASWCEENNVDAYISTQRQRRSAEAGSDPAPPEPPITPQQKMRAKVASPEGQKIYRRRKCIPEPVFGQIKQAMGFRRFSMRGKNKASGEWSLICTCHNIRKLWVAGKSTLAAAA